MISRCGAPDSFAFNHLAQVRNSKRAMVTQALGGACSETAICRAAHVRLPVARPKESCFPQARRSMSNRAMALVGSQKMARSSRAEALGSSGRSHLRGRGGRAGANHTGGNHPSGCFPPDRLSGNLCGRRGSSDPRRSSLRRQASPRTWRGALLSILGACGRGSARYLSR